MEPFKCFELMIEQVKKASVAVAFKNQIISDIEYFKTQSLCDLDRRDRPSEIRKRWRDFEGVTRGLGFFDDLKKRDDVWRVVRCFVFDAEPSSLLVPPVERLNNSSTSKYANWNPEDFFEYVYKKAEVTPRISAEEELVLAHGLLYLKASAGLPKPKRDQHRIKKVWKSLHPILTKLRVMDEFAKEDGLKNRMRLFLENTF